MLNQQRRHPYRPWHACLEFTLPTSPRILTRSGGYVGISKEAIRSAGVLPAGPQPVRLCYEIAAFGISSDLIHCRYSPWGGAVAPALRRSRAASMAATSAGV